jgi:hypothetical protein
VKLRIRYAFHPDNLSAKNPRLVEDLQDFSLEAIVATIKMIADFYEFGLESRYVKKLQGLPMWKLKTQSRGGVKGGTRVYFFVSGDDAVFVNCEVKDDDTPSVNKLREVAQIALAHTKGIKVWKGEGHENETQT